MFISMITALADFIGAGGVHLWPWQPILRTTNVNVDDASSIALLLRLAMAANKEQYALN